MTFFLPLIFTAALFLNAFLLFFVQPMFAKMILPLLGGSPQVWNTCMMFFQAALLAGYGYAHFQSKGTAGKGKLWLHFILLAVAFWILPVHLSSWISPAPPAETTPIPWLLGMLVLSVGLPFMMISTGAPLLQNWFSRSPHPAAQDPYFLYAASNLGSLAALLSYPLFFEPHWTLPEQARLWTWGYGILIVFTLLCALSIHLSSPAGFSLNQHWEVRRPMKPSSSPAGFSLNQHALSGDSSIKSNSKIPAFTGMARNPSFGEKIFWIVISFAASSWMLGVTTYLSNDIAAIPLLWVIPLSIYLFSFVIAFSETGRKMAAPLLWIFPILLTTLIAMNLTQRPTNLLLPWNLICFFVGVILLHCQLAEKRPSAEHLTEYYLWMAAGGMLGGVFNSLLAPVLFRSIAEYPLILILVSFLRPFHPAPRKRIDPLLDWLLPLFTGGIVAGLTFAILAVPAENEKLQWILSALYSAVPVFLCFSFRRHRVRFGLGILCFLFAGSMMSPKHKYGLHSARTFFGVHEVSFRPQEKLHVLTHGNTIHGYQNLESPEVPLGYYHLQSPIGKVFEKIKLEPGGRVGLVGLGAGTLAAYSKPGEKWTFFEIDPEVERIARNPDYFSYLSRAKADYQIILGDARLSLQKIPDHSFDLLILDAFSSDAIPVHLITREALELYLKKLKPRGLMAFHISNRYLDLEPVLGSLAAELKLTAYSQWDSEDSQKEKQGITSTRWVVMARQKEDLDFLGLEEKASWNPARVKEDAALLWTDQFSNLLRVYRPSLEWLSRQSKA